MKEINKKEIKEAILAEAKRIKRKKELFEEIKKISQEVSVLNEAGMAGSFGFANSNDAMNKSKTGFVQDPTQPKPHISKVLQDLEEEMMAQESADKLEDENDVEKLQQENSELREQLKSIEETMKKFNL